MDVPGHADALIITDAAVNIAPDLEDKVDIVQNAIDLAHALGVQRGAGGDPAARWRRSIPKVPSTLEAAALCKMADRGQITGALLDGPLALDNAISPEAAAIKKIVSPVAGRANMLVVPDLEAGNMLAKSLSFLAGADAAGIVLGARVPIILTSRADVAADAAGVLRGRALLVGRRRGARHAKRRLPELTAMTDVHCRDQRGLVEHQVRLLSTPQADIELLCRGQIEKIGIAPRCRSSRCRRRHGGRARMARPRLRPSRGDRGDPATARDLLGGTRSPASATG